MRSVNLTSLPQAVVNRPGWLNNNYIGVVMSLKTAVTAHEIVFKDLGQGSTKCGRIKVVYH